MPDDSRTTVGRAFAPTGVAGLDIVGDQLRAKVLETLFDEPSEATRFDRFVILRRVGAGAMGTVFAAYDPRLDRQIALKVLFASDERARKRHLTEARTLARLSHPCVVSVHDAGEHDGRLFVAMEFVPGESLEERLGRGGLAIASIRALFIQAGEGLAAAHRAGIVHRDFKPANVLVGDDGRVRVADFGLALPVAPPPMDLEHHDPTLGGPSGATSGTTGGVVGTPLYMAPEQIQGQPADARADQFSFCVSLYEALAGTHPYPEANWEHRLGQIREARPAAWGSWPAPKWIRTILLRGMAFDPAARFESMDALLIELSGRRRRRYVRLAGSALVLAGAFGVFELGRSATPSPCEDVAASTIAAWEGDRIAAVAEAFERSELAYAAVSWSSTRDLLDAYTDRLAGAQRDACEATWVRHEQSEATYDLRTRCLARARQDLRATIDVLSEGGDVLRTAHALVGHLPDISACARTERLADVIDLPHDPVVRQGIAVSRSVLAGLRARHVARQAGIGPALEDVRASVLPLDYAPLTAELELLSGDVARRDGDGAGARAAYKQALWLAEGARHDEVAARAACALAEVVAAEDLDPGRAEDWLQHARAIHRRGGLTDGVTSTIARLETTLALQRGDGNQAVQWAQRAMALADDDPTRILSALIHLAEGEMMVGDAAAARGHFEDALSLVLGEFGAGHPHEGTLLANYGGALSVLDEPGAAVVHLRRAATLMVAEYGPDHIRTASVWGNLAQALVGVGQTEEAIELYRQVTAVLVASFGDHHPQVATAYLNTAEAFRVADRPTEALEACEAADAALGTEPIGRVAAFVSICLGGALQELGRSPEAVAVLGPFARGEIQLEEPALHAELRYLYGVSLYDTGAKRDAVDWVRGSVAAIRAAQGLTEGELSAPERWLEQHDKTGPTKIAEPRG